MSELLELLAPVRQCGRGRWLGVRPQASGAMLEPEAGEARREAGLTGDHARPGPRNARQVTRIQWEHLAVVSALLEREITPADLRRNIAVAGINLFSLKGRRFGIGQALLETTGWCQRLGLGTFQAMRGMAGSPRG